MKIPMTEICGSCEDISKFNDILIHDDMIAAEYICDCGSMQRALLEEIEFVRPEKRDCMNCYHNLWGYCYKTKQSTYRDLYCEKYRRK